MWQCAERGGTYRIAHPSLGAQAASLHIILAVVRRVHQIHQVRVAVGFEPVILGEQHAAPVLALLLHLVGSVVLLLQQGSDLGEKECYNIL